MDSKHIEKLKQFGDLRENVLLSTLTTLRIGGPVDGVLYPDSIFGLIYSIEYCNQNDIPCRVFGNGSNILASDDRYPGIIIKLSRTLQRTYLLGEKVFAEAGASLIALCHQISQEGLTGLEWAAGIPATVGGATFMNAGAYLSSMRESIEKVFVLKDGYCVWMSVDDCQFTYRKSIFQQHRDWIIVGVLFNFKYADINEIRTVLKKRQQQRLDTQPLQAYSCGSTFRNHPDHPSWKVIDSLGLRGYSIGGAQVSEKHTNFLINKQHASFDDMYKLIRHVQKEVYDKYNFELILEVEQFNWKTNQ